MCIRDSALESFEARVDMNDTEQVAMLEHMRRETHELERLRGVWYAPISFLFFFLPLPSLLGAPYVGKTK